MISSDWKSQVQSTVWEAAGMQPLSRGISQKYMLFNACLLEVFFSFCSAALCSLWSPGVTSWLMEASV